MPWCNSCGPSLLQSVTCAFFGAHMVMGGLAKEDFAMEHREKS